MATNAIPNQLDHCVEIYVPTQCRCGKPLPEDIQEVHVLEVEWNFLVGLPVLDVLLDALPASHSRTPRKSLHAGLHD